MKWKVRFQQLGFRSRTFKFGQFELLAKWLLKYPEGGDHGVRILRVWGPTITELPILQALGAYTSTNDWREIIEQLFAQMMGWA